jgi:hypothetical protein
MAMNNSRTTMAASGCDDGNSRTTMAAAGDDQLVRRWQRAGVTMVMNYLHDDGGGPV